MNPTTRPPDIFHNKDEPIPDELIPEGCYIHYGAHLMLTARPKGIPYGEAKKRTYVPNTSNSRKETVGIVLFLTDRERFEHALANKNAKKKYPARR